MPSPGALAAASPDRLLPELLPWLLVLLGVVAASAIVIYLVRRSLGTEDDVPDDGFTLHGLRQMHARGDLTDDEFERAKTALVDRTRGTTSENSADADAGTNGPPDASAPRAGST